MADQKSSSKSKPRAGKLDSSQMQFAGFDDPAVPLSASATPATPAEVPASPAESLGSPQTPLASSAVPIAPSLPTAGVQTAPTTAQPTDALLSPSAAVMSATTISATAATWTLNTEIAPCAAEPAPDLQDQLVVVVDSHSLIYQLFHALPPMNSPTGLPVSTVHGFIGDMLELVRRKRPAYVICAFDLSEITFRNQLSEQYKAHREAMPDELRQQIPLIRAAIDAMGIGIMQCAGFEADDILATVARQVEAAGGRCLIVTSDKDCRQLITDRVRLYHIRKDTEMGAEELMADWGVRPDQVVDFQSMVGDPVDNVPGIPLIGPKLAQQLLQQFDTLDAILDNPDAVSGAKRKENIRNGREQALLSRELVRLRSDVPCEIPWSRSQFKIDLSRLDPMLEHFGFRRLRTRVAELIGAAPPSASAAGQGESPTAAARETEASFAASPFAMSTHAASSMPQPSAPWESDYQTITQIDALERLVEQLSALPCIAIDTETTGTDARGCDLVGISIAWQVGQAAYIPIRAPLGAPQLDEAEVIKRLRPILENPEIAKIGQNIKFDSIVLRTAGANLAGLTMDTMVADYLLNPGQRNHTLDDLSKRYLQHDAVPIQALIGTGKNQISMDQVEIGLITNYACEDVDIPFRIAPIVHEQLADQGLRSLFSDVEIPLIEVLAEMEFNGIRVDVDHLAAMSSLFSQKIETLSREIYEAAGGPINLDSPKQLAALLFDRLKLPVVKKTKTGVSTDADVLQTLAMQHPLPATILEYRQATKLKNTYIDALPKLVNARTGRVHTSFRQDVAATGRLSSTEPNLQNIPIRTEEGRAIRGAFRAGSDDWLLLAADYSQIELRVLAHYSGDEALMEAYQQDRDIHTSVAAEVHGIAQNEVTSDMRRMAKTINFGIVYGQSPFGLAKTLGISKDEAAAYIELYFARYPGVQEFMLSTMDQCRRQGYVTTMLGRRRDIQGIRDLRNADINKRRNLTEAERIAVNTVIQGSAADMIKLAMISIYRKLSQSSLQAKLLLQIHDELLFEVAPADAAALKELVRTEMNEVAKLRVPLKVEIGIGKTWAEV